MRVIVEGQPIDVPDDASVDEIDAIHRSMFGPDVDASAPSTPSLLLGVAKDALKEDPTLFAGPGAKVASEIMSQTIGRPFNAALQQTASVIKQTGEEDQSPGAYIQKLLYNPEAAYKGFIENKAPTAQDYLTPAGEAKLGKAGEPLAQSLNFLLGFVPGTDITKKAATEAERTAALPDVNLGELFQPLAERAKSAENIQNYSASAKVSGAEASRLLAEKQALMQQAAAVDAELSKLAPDIGSEKAVTTSTTLGEKPAAIGGNDIRESINQSLNFDPVTGQYKPLPPASTRTVTGEAVPSEMGLFQNKERIGLETKLSDLLGQAQEKGQRAADLIAQGRTAKGVVRSEINHTNLKGAITPDTPASFAMLPPEARLLTDELIDPEVKQLIKENVPKPGALRQLLRSSVGDPRLTVLKEEPHAYPVVQALTEGAVERQGLEARGHDLLGVDQGGTWEQLGKLKKQNPQEYLSLRKNVVNALEHREKAAAYLRTPFEKEVFDKAKSVFDFYGPLLEQQGVRLRQNYFTHQVLTDEKPLDALYTNLPEELKAGVEKQRGANLPYSTDIESVMKNYVDQVSRSLAYKKAVNAYQGLGIKSPVAADLVKHVLFPENKSSSLSAWIMRKRFDAFVRYNLISAFENRSQVQLALAQADPKAAALYKDLANHADKIGIEADLARAFIGQAEDAGSMGHFHVHGNWLDRLSFMGSEFRNRIESRAVGFAEELVNNPAYQELRKQGVPKIEAAKRILADPAVKQRAMQRADALTANTQFEVEAGFRPGAQEALAKTPLTQPLAQFTRYPVSSVEAILNSMTKNGRELTILSKGLSDEASLVAHVRALRSMRDGAHAAAKKYPGRAAEFNKVADALTEDIAQWEPAIAKLPQGTTANAAYRLARLTGRTFLGKAGRAGIKALLGSVLFNQTPDVGKALLTAATQAIPGVGALSTLSQMSGVGNQQYPVSLKNLLIEMGVLISPLAPLESIPGRPLTKSIKEILK